VVIENNQRSKISSAAKNSAGAYRRAALRRRCLAACRKLGICSARFSGTRGRGGGRRREIKALRWCEWRLINQLSRNNSWHGIAIESIKAAGVAGEMAPGGRNTHEKRKSNSGGKALRKKAWRKSRKLISYRGCGENGNCGEKLENPVHKTAELKSAKSYISLYRK